MSFDDLAARQCHDNKCHYCGKQLWAEDDPELEDGEVLDMVYSLDLDAGGTMPEAVAAWCSFDCFKLDLTVSKSARAPQPAPSPSAVV